MCSAVSASPITGRIGWYPENKVWVYDSETQSWSALPPMPTLRGALAAVGEDSVGMELSDGLTAGGRVEVVGTMEVFDTEKNSWTTLKSMPCAQVRYVIGESSYSRFPTEALRESCRVFRLGEAEHYEITVVVVNGIRQRRH